MSWQSLTSDEAAEYLGISKSSLYSYVSRGLVHARPAAPGSRRKQYDKSDLDRLKLRGNNAAGNDVRDDVLDFGKPILSTSISLVTDNEHSYRGIPSAELAETSSFEQVAEFLWTGVVEAGSSEGGSAILVPASSFWGEPLDRDIVSGVGTKLPPVNKLQCLLPRLGHDDLSGYGTSHEILLPAAVRVIKYLTLLSTGKDPRSGVAETLAAAWGTSVEVLQKILIVAADHELNIATFTARCAASAGSNIYQSILCGLAALQGHKHLFGQIAESERFLHTVLESQDPEATLRDYLRLEGSIPGFHNPYRRLYSGQDPRVLTLLGRLRQEPAFDLVANTIELVESATGEFPRIDFALAVCQVLLRLPNNAIFDLVAVARTAGMVAHIIEQYGSSHTIRPRARYEPGKRARSIPDR